MARGLTDTGHPEQRPKRPNPRTTPHTDPGRHHATPHRDQRAVSSPVHPRREGARTRGTRPPPVSSRAGGCTRAAQPMGGTGAHHHLSAPPFTRERGRPTSHMPAPRHPPLHPSHRGETPPDLTPEKEPPHHPTRADTPYTDSHNQPSHPPAGAGQQHAVPEAALAGHHHGNGEQPDTGGGTSPTAGHPLTRGEQSS